MYILGLEQKWNVSVGNVTASEMYPMSLTCNHPPFCAPPGKFRWYKIEGKTPSMVMINKRIMIDNNGISLEMNVFFAPIVNVST